MISITKKKGFALIFSFIVTSVIFLIVISYSLSSINDLILSDRITNTIRAYYVADAGLADAFMRLRASAYPADFTTSNSSYPVGTGSDTGSYSVNVTSDSATWPTYTITSAATYRGVTKTLRLVVKGVSFSRWSYLSDSEIDVRWQDLWLTTGMTIAGPAHTNSMFLIWGDPVFDGPASQTDRELRYHDDKTHTDNPDFQNGIALGAPAITLPARPVSPRSRLGELMTSITNAASSGGLVLTGDTAITLLPDGTMNVTNAGYEWTDQNMPMPANGALVVWDGNVTVGGILNGALTIGCGDNIYINGSILYHLDPRVDPASTDILGLVAQSDVIVTDGAPYNMEIDGYIVALNGAFYVQNYSASLKGNLVLFGGLTNNTRGPTCSYSPETGELLAGYNTLQYYDGRLEDGAPLWFTPAKDDRGRLAYRKVLFNEI